MSLTSVRLGLLIAILVGISSVYATTYHVEANGWWVDDSGANHTFSKSGDVSDANTNVELQPSGDPYFYVELNKDKVEDEDIETIKEFLLKK